MSRRETPARFTRRDLAWAWAMATVFSGLPSTLAALASGSDPLEATRAAGAMWGALLGGTLQWRGRHRS